MTVPPISIRQITHTDVYISGDVVIEEGAAIAPGVILRAAPESKIIIRSAACLGMGTIVNAFGGTIEIGKSSILGASVLIVGKGTIGANVCIGPATTVFNSSIDSSSVILAGSLIGELTVAATPQEPNQSESVVVEQENLSTTEQAKSSVVGQVYINQLLLTLFPGRQSPPKTQDS
jgi:carbon dioxide concentrating mechanism protein CcmN